MNTVKIGRITYWRFGHESFVGVSFPHMICKKRKHFIKWWLISKMVSRNFAITYNCSHDSLKIIIKLLLLRILFLVLPAIISIKYEVFQNFLALVVQPFEKMQVLNILEKLMQRIDELCKNCVFKKRTQNETTNPSQ